MFYLFGLGNPEASYESTRHNIGRTALRAFAQKNGIAEFSRDGHLDATVARGGVPGREIALILPETYMNRSGETAKKLADKPDFPENLLVVHDELDLPFGTIRISYDRSSAGHNGVQSVADALGTQAFARVRIGVAPLDEEGNIRKVHGEEAVSRFVLAPFNEKERAALPDIIERAVAALDLYLAEGREAAMQKYN